MYLKRIELHGFKSFAGNTDVLLEPGITGIVGPNGSGKSNIVDALRWVLGEQSSRNLRGATMQDVIFKGTQRRSQKGSCEVSLVFDNADHRLKTDYSELRVSRGISRSGDSEYRINGSPCRLRDIQALFTDTGIGKDGYSIIGQGRIHQILEDKASERRHVFEEAAGIMKYRAAKEEAERNLERTRGNIERVTDIIGELKEQAGPLRVQMEQAREYLTLSSELRRLEVGALLADYDQADERAKTEQAATEMAARQAHELSLYKEQLQREKEALREAHTRAETHLSETSEKMRSAEKEEAAQAGRQAVEEERIRSYQTQLAAIRARRLELAAACSEAAAAAERAENQLQELEGAVAAADERIAPLSRQLEELEAAEPGTDSAAASAEQLAERSAAQRAQGQRLRVQAGELRGRAGLVEATVDKLAIELSAAETDFERCRARRQKAENAARKAAERYAYANKTLESASEALRRTENELRETLNRLASAQGREESLSRAQSEYEGYYESVRRLMRDSSSPALSKLIIGVVGECIAVEPQHEKAIETALGSAAENVIVPNDQCARSLVAYLRQKRYGRVTFLPAEALRIRRLSNQERGVLSESGVLCAASEAVRCSPEVRPAVDHLLGRTVIVDNLDTALRLKREGKNSFRIVTAAGEVISPGGAITGGDSRRNQRGFLERRRVVEEARQIVRDLQRKARNLEVHRSSEAETLSGAQDRNQDCIGALAEARAQHERIAAELDGCRERLEQIQAQHSEQKHALEELRSQTGQLENEAAAAERDAHILEQKAELKRQSDAALAECQTQRALQAAEVRTQIAQISEQRTSLSGSRQLAQEALSRARKAEEDSTSELRQLDQREHEISRSLRLTAAEHELSSERQNDLAAEILRVAEEGKTAAQDVSRLQKRIEDLDARHAELEERFRGLLRKEYASKAELEKAVEHKADCIDRLWSDYELTLGNARSEVPRPAPKRDSRARISEIRDQLRGLGAVNPHAPQDYSNLTTRIEDLEAQAGDLDAARRDLESVINDLGAGMERIFREKFRSINEHFEQIFAELFGGGSASLILEEGEDVMNAGIEIKAEPPGKKVQNLALMSGGERALTAVALVFAMLAVNPSPVCLLDEIDAPLDDRNVGRLASYLKKLSDHLQFIVITHKKTTMAVCDALYGVVMHEKGISDLVSVQLA